jgi:hypothetical protein
MLRHILLGAAALVAGSAIVVQAAAKDDVQAAVQKLADSSSYSWTTDSESGFGSNTTTGATEKDGYTTVTLGFGDNTSPVVIKGSKAVIKTDSGWQTPDEITSADQGGGGFNPEMFVAYMAQSFKTPAAEVQADLPNLENVKEADNVYSADLTADAAKQMLSFRGRRGRRGRRGGAAAANAGGNGANANGGAAPADNNGPQISDAKATVKFWIADGALSKFEVHVTGTMSFNGNDRDIDRTTTTEIKDLGTAKVDVPAEAKAKLGS